MYRTYEHSQMIMVQYFEELNKWHQSIHSDNDWANIQILEQIEENLGLTFVPEPFDSAQGTAGNVCMANSPEVRDDYKETFSPIDLLDYIYAVLHSPTYHGKYKEFLKIDFPRLPYPNDIKNFWQLVALGGELRQLHLLESPKVEEFSTSYPIDGDNKVTRKLTKSGPGFEPNANVTLSAIEGQSARSGSTKRNISTMGRGPSGNFISAATSRHKNG